MLRLLVISLIETDGTYVSFWAEKPPNLLRLQLDAMLGFNFLGALTDAEITGCGRVEFRGKNEIFLPLLCARGLGEAGAVLEILMVWLELDAEGCSSWVFFCYAGGLV